VLGGALGGAGALYLPLLSFNSEGIPPGGGIGCAGEVPCSPFKH